MTALAAYLRLTAAFLLLALPAVFLPYAWMNAIHETLGLGALPDTPLVSYLTRSLSALYIMLGMLYGYAATDVPRHLPLVRFSVWLSLGFTLAIVGIDLASDLPAWWTGTEAVVLIGWTAGMWLLVRRAEMNGSPTR